MFGGESTVITDLEVDGNNNLFITGAAYYSASQTDILPIEGSGSTYVQSTDNGNTDAFAAKIAGRKDLVWSTYFGGGGVDSGNSITVDDYGNVYLAGKTTSSSASFPVKPFTSNPLSFYDNTYNGNDIFIARFTNSGEQEWTTFFGGSGVEFNPRVIYDIANDLVFLSASTNSTNLSTSSPSGGLFYQASLNTNGSTGQYDAFLLTLNNNLEQGWTTYFGGYGTGPAQKDDRAGSLDIYEGNLIMVGSSGSTDPKIPVQDPGGGAYFQPELAGNAMIKDGFIVKFIVDGGAVVSTSNITDIFEVHIFPNPFSDEIIISLKENQHNVSLNVFDSLGKSIYAKQKLIGGTNYLNLSHLPSGIYFLTINQLGKVKTYKIVKK